MAPKYILCGVGAKSCHPEISLSFYPSILHTRCVWTKTITLEACSTLSERLTSRHLNDLFTSTLQVKNETLWSRTPSSLGRYSPRPYFLINSFSGTRIFSFPDSLLYVCMYVCTHGDFLFVCLFVFVHFPFILFLFYRLESSCKNQIFFCWNHRVLYRERGNGEVF